MFYCPVEATLSILGGKWKTVIIWHLKEGALRNGELMNGMPGISPKMLTKQLRELESDGIVTREMFSEIPPRVEYSLSDKGRTIIPILEAMCEWGIENMSDRLMRCDGAGHDDR